MMTLARLSDHSRQIANSLSRWLGIIVAVVAAATFLLIANNNLSLDLEVDGIGALNPYFAAAVFYAIALLVMYLAVFVTTLLILALKNLWHNKSAMNSNNEN